MGELITHRVQYPYGRYQPTGALVHDFGHAPLPAFTWVTQPRPIGDPGHPGGAEARLSGMLQLGPMAFYAELIEVGYTEVGCQEFIAEQDVHTNECERNCGPDIHRAIGASAQTLLWKGREYALVILPYGR